MNDNEIVAVLKEIIGRTARSFYEDRFVIALDFLNRHPALVSDLCISLTRRLKDDELAVFMRLKTRDLHKIMGKLKEERLIRVETKEFKRSDSSNARSFPSSYFFLDYQLFFNALNYNCIV